MALSRGTSSGLEGERVRNMTAHTSRMLSARAMLSDSLPARPFSACRRDRTRPRRCRCAGQRVCARSGHVLQFDVLDDEDLPVQLTVGGDGTVQAPLIGSVSLAGLSLPDARAFSPTPTRKSSSTSIRRSHCRS